MQRQVIEFTIGHSTYDAVYAALQSLSSGPPIEYSTHFVVFNSAQHPSLLVACAELTSVNTDLKTEQEQEHNEKEESDKESISKRVPISWSCQLRDKNAGLAGSSASNGTTPSKPTIKSEQYSSADFVQGNPLTFLPRLGYAFSHEYVRSGYGFFFFFFFFIY